MLNPETQALREALSRIIATDNLDRAKELAIEALCKADRLQGLLPIGYQFEHEVEDPLLGKCIQRFRVIGFEPSPLDPDKLTNQWQIEVV